MRSRACARRFALDATGTQPHHAAAAARELRIVRHQDQRHAAIDMPAKQKLDHLLSGRLVEIAGRLVGDENRGVGASARASATRCCSPPDNCAG